MSEPDLPKVEKRLPRALTEREIESISLNQTSPIREDYEIAP
jgi:hypothetical protein